MATKKYNPITPSLRFRISNSYAEITTNKPEKSLLISNNKSGGRNQKGEMTMRYIGGGHKRQYRIIDFKRNKFDIPATVKTIEYDPNRSAFIALVVYKDGEKCYIIAPEGLQVGQEIISGKSVAPEVGNTLPLANMPLGSVIHNIELQPGKGASICRSAGTFAQLSGKDGKYVNVKLPSGEARQILGTCLATIGSVSNSDHSLEVHPMGGGEGRASGGHPRSRKGIPAKGLKTRSKTKASNKHIISRAKK